MNFFRLFGITIGFMILSLGSAMAGEGGDYGGASGGGGIELRTPELIYGGNASENPFIFCPSGNTFECAECNQALGPMGEQNQTELARICANHDGFYI